MGPIRSIEPTKTAGFLDGIRGTLQDWRMNRDLAYRVPNLLQRGQLDALQLKKNQLQIDKLMKNNNIFKLITAGGIGAALAALLVSQRQNEANRNAAPTMIRYGG